MSLEAAFVRTSAIYLRDTYLPRLAKALEALPAGALWSRPHGGTNSIGNLLLHLEGNVRQWILGGLRGDSDQRKRSAEFAAKEGASSDELLDRLRATVVEASRVIEELNGPALLATYTIQGFSVTGLEAVYHVVEHFSWHTGQITARAKECAGPAHGIAFYDDDALESPRR